MKKHISEETQTNCNLTKNMFNYEFPIMIKITMLYSYKINRKEDLTRLVESINNKLLDLVIHVIQDKEDIGQIFQQLKKEFKVSKTALTKEYIIRWYAQLFEKF